MSRPASALLLQSGEGEAIVDSTAREVRVVADHPMLAITHSRYGPDEKGPPLHVHEMHADAWWILDGELTFRFGQPDEVAEVTVGPGGFVLAPPMLPHAFENRGVVDARYLNFHAPDEGFTKSLRARRDGTGQGEGEGEGEPDQHPPPIAGCLPSSAALVLHRDQGHRLDFAPGHVVTIKCGSAHGIGSLIIAESTLPAHFPGPLPHSHDRLVDCFWVLEGALDLRLGETWTTGLPGDFALVPPGTVHTIANRTASPVRVLNIAAPGGYERFLVEVAQAFAEAGGAAPDPARMAEIGGRHDYTIAT